MKKLTKGFKMIVGMKGEPKYIAKGFALGSFIGMMPIPGFQMMVSVSLAALFRINKKAACIGVFNTNLATGLFVFAFNFWLGKQLLGFESNFEMPDKLGFSFVKTVFNAGSEVFISMTVGGIITGIVSAAISYFLIREILIRKQQKSKNNEE